MVLVVTPSKRATPCWRWTTKLPASRSSKNPSAARARGRARRWGILRPVTSVSESTATLASGRMNPLVMGAATTATPGVPGAASSTGAWMPSSPRAADRRAAPGTVAAHRVTAYPSSTNRVTPAASRAGSPATGSKRRTVSAVTEGPSGTGGSAATAAAAVAQQPLEGHVEGREPVLVLLGPPRGCQRLGQCRLLVEQLGAPVPDAARLHQQHLRTLPEEVGQHPLLAVQEGEPRLHAVELFAALQAFPHRGPPGPAAHEQRRGGAQLRGDDELPAPVKGDGVQVVRRPLVADGKGGEAVDLVAPQVDADRLVRRGGEHVDDAAPHRELPAVLDLVLAPVALGHQLGQAGTRRRPAAPGG